LQNHRPVGDGWAAANHPSQNRVDQIASNDQLEFSAWWCVHHPFGQGDAGVKDTPEGIKNSILYLFKCYFGSENRKCVHVGSFSVSDYHPIDHDFRFHCILKQFPLFSETSFQSGNCFTPRSQRPASRTKLSGLFDYWRPAGSGALRLHLRWDMGRSRYKYVYNECPHFLLLSALDKLTKISNFEPNSIWHCQLVLRSE
jgi:hypothetical protein